MSSTKNPIATAKVLYAYSHDLGTSVQEETRQGRNPIEEFGPLVDQQEQPMEARATLPEPAVSLPRPRTPTPRRSKLSFKNRWLISVDVVAALRRAGVTCDIVIPALYADMPGLTRH